MKHFNAMATSLIFSGLGLALVICFTSCGQPSLATATTAKPAATMADGSLATKNNTVVSTNTATTAQTAPIPSSSTTGTTTTGAVPAAATTAIATNPTASNPVTTGPTPTPSSSNNLITVELKVKETWSGGYCSYIVIHNTSTTAITNWKLTLKAGGALIDDPWNISLIVGIGTYTIQPTATWNKNIAAGQDNDTQGFCASLSNAGAMATVQTLTVVQ